ncbi:hypothetical protein [Actinomycetospora sp. TBRC 11914]|uniref:hypothetical protein n=1 Tax=Actinomycetospora sp. TBRC 11914 TaxID=2729387 RepID=UPI00145F298B|nr:hypothetical protein [Actinomycetospora sp. TBRC 11914]NMO93916.1 hypothetical protein [Actinomycetospora sp. TBRC 11914]
MVRSQHYKNCEEARLHQCRCTWCGGALHGWIGWIDLTREAQGSSEREEELRDRAETEWKRYKDPSRRRRRRRQLREQVVDRVRLDLVRWLKGRPQPDLVPSPRLGQTPRRRLDDAGDESASTNTTATDPNLPRQPTPESAAEHIGGPRLPDLQGAGSPPSTSLSLADHAEALADTVARKTWDDLKDEPYLADPEVRRALANHFWCSLFLALAQLVSEFQETLDKIPSTAKSTIKELLRPGNRNSGLDALLTDLVIDKTIDQAWSNLQTALTAGSPLLTMATSKQTVQAFQLLAVFSCPNPDKHQAVRLQAINPLARDVAGAVTDEAKERLLDVFQDQIDDARPEFAAGSPVPGRRVAGAP